jgi:hypothetical protein
MPSFKIGASTEVDPFKIMADTYIVPLDPSTPLDLSASMPQIVAAWGDKFVDEIPRPSARRDGEIHIVSDMFHLCQVVYVVDSHAKPFGDLLSEAFAQASITQLLNARDVVIAPFQARGVNGHYTDRKEMVTDLADTLTVMQAGADRFITIRTVTVNFSPVNFRDIDPVKLFMDRHNQK